MSTDDILFEAYPFLVSASASLEYCTVVTPESFPLPIYANAGADCLDAPLFRREVINSENGDHTIFHCAVVARRPDGTVYRDKKDGGGREVIRYEGLVIKGRVRNAPIREAHLAHVHELLTPYFEEFFSFDKVSGRSRLPLVCKQIVRITQNDYSAEDVLIPRDEGIRDHGHRPVRVRHYPVSQGTEQPRNLNHSERKEFILPNNHSILPKDTSAVKFLNARTALTCSAGRLLVFDILENKSSCILDIERRWHTFDKIDSISDTSGIYRAILGNNNEFHFYDSKKLIEKNDIYPSPLLREPALLHIHERIEEPRWASMCFVDFSHLLYICNLGTFICKPDYGFSWESESVIRPLWSSRSQAFLMQSEPQNHLEFSKVMQIAADTQSIASSTLIALTTETPKASSLERQAYLLEWTKGSFQILLLKTLKLNEPIAAIAVNRNSDCAAYAIRKDIVLLRRSSEPDRCSCNAPISRLAFTACGRFLLVGYHNGMIEWRRLPQLAFIHADARQDGASILALYALDDLSCYSVGWNADLIRHAAPPAEKVERRLGGFLRNAVERLAPDTGDNDG